ncbi:MAG: peptidylprolyl isomerase [Proteobacteria bacterium]|nr:peptidylprolyl isomerase [Pseudomonadota bacterium]
MRPSLLFSLVLALILNLAGPCPAGAAQVVDQIIARVGSEPVTQRQVEFILADNPDFSREEALQVLIERKLVLSWARDNRLSVSPEELEKAEKAFLDNGQMSMDRFEEFLASRGQDKRDFEDNLKEQLLIRKALNAAVGSKVRVTEEEMRERYDTSYPPRETFVISHILLTPESPSSGSEGGVEDLAPRIMDRLESGVPFETLAREHSADRVSAPKGGLLGTFQKGELLPELESLAADLDPGEIGGPVRTNLGLHILRLENKSLLPPPPFTEVEDEIRAALMEEKGREIQDEWFRELKENTYIEILTDGG